MLFFALGNRNVSAFRASLTVRHANGSATMTSPALYSPLVYKQRYENLPVMLENGNTVTVSVHKYVNAGLAQFHNPAARDAFLTKLNSAGVDIELRVDSGHGLQSVDASVLHNVPLFARYVFAGKGAPEHCQIVLQLANHWNLAPQGLQAYADASLGLDCNGFVGNYLWHIIDERPWSEMGHDHTDGPDTGISGYLDKRKKISLFGEIKRGRCYILGRSDAGGNVIDKVAGDDAAHIAITEPGLSGNAVHSRTDLSYTLDDAPLTWGFRPNHLRTWSKPGPLGSEGPVLADPGLDAIFVVESTASAKQPGLSASWYRLKRMSKHGKAGVFDLYRESMAVHQRLLFQIAEVG